MQDYDPNDLSNTLSYIKDRFGINVFTEQGRVLSIFSDLAPKLKKERIMLDRLSHNGVLTDFASCAGRSESDQKRVMAKGITQLVQMEGIQPDIAAFYLNTLAVALRWSTVSIEAHRMLHEVDVVKPVLPKTKAILLMEDSIPLEWLESHRNSWSEYPVLGNQAVLRKSVRSVVFLNSLSGKSTNAAR